MNRTQESTQGKDSSEDLVIWDLPETPPADNSVYLFWKSFVLASDGRQHSIPLIIDQERFKIREIYLNWIGEVFGQISSDPSVRVHSLLDEGFNYTNLMPIMEMNVFSKSPQIDTAIRLIALLEFIKARNFRSLKYNGADPVLSRTLEQFSKDTGLSYTSNSFPQNNNFSLLKLVKRYISSKSAITWIAVQWLRTTPLRFLNPPWSAGNQSSINFVSYWANFDKKKNAEGKFVSDYWGNLPSLLQQQNILTSWLHISPVKPSLFNSWCERRQIARINKHERFQNHQHLYSLFSLSVVKRVILNFIRIRRAFKDVDRNIFSSTELGFLWPLFEDEFKNSISRINLAENLIKYELIRRYSSGVRVESTLLYLYEGQPWEGVLNFFLSRRNCNKRFGVQHSSVRFWDLRNFQFSVPNRGSGPLECYFPTSVLLNGAMAEKTFCSGVTKQLDHVNVESLRLLTAKPRNLSELERPRDIPSQYILIIGSFLDEESQQTLNLSLNAFLDWPEVSLVFKPHPLLHTANIGKNSKRIIESELEINQLIRYADFVIAAPSTTGALNAVISGVPLVTFLSPTYLNLSPLYGLPEFNFFATSRELREHYLVRSGHSSAQFDSESLILIGRNLELWSMFIDAHLHD